MQLNKLPKEVPFDQFSRQYQVMTILDKLRTKGESYAVLDVGGYKGRTADFLSSDKVTVLDLFEDVKDKDYVLGSALEMPFSDKSFDFVLSFDVLEHIPPKDRNKFFEECDRVAKRGIIICAPHKTPANEYAETSLNNFYKSLHSESHRWLKEHIDYGIPDFALLEKQAAKKGFSTACFHSNKTQLWVAVQQAIFINSKYDMAAQDLVAINDFYNKNIMFDGGGASEAAYRLILCCFRQAKDAKALEGMLKDLNKPIAPELEIQLYEKIAKFNAAIINKTDTLSTNYKDLYEHEHKRSEALQANGEKLWQTINELNAQLNARLGRRVKSKLVKMRRTRS